MKYFAIRAEKLAHPLPNLEQGVAYELSEKKALEMYTVATKDQYKAVERFGIGIRVTCKYWSVWGENLSDTECFRRRLAGKMAAEILE